MTGYTKYSDKINNAFFELDILLGCM